MNRFIVISPGAEQIQTAVQEKFPDAHYEIMPGVWAVADANKVPSDIAVMLDIDGSNANGNTGVVFYAEGYNGFYHSALWEKLNLWERL